METAKRDFQAELKIICAQGAPKEPEPKKQVLEVPAGEPRFNVLKQTETGTKFVEFGITLGDVLLGLSGRFKDTDKVKYHIVSEGRSLRTWKELYGDALQTTGTNYEN